VTAVTGEIDDEQRRERVAELGRSTHRILVATDCLSEGVNLQEHFDSVVHYDLPWNPNRLEQREGRVDRFGQPRDEVKMVLLYGANNPVDQVVLEVLIRKARKIRRDLGIAVPVPMDAEQVIQTVVDNVLLRGRDAVQLELALATPEASRLHEAWDAAAEREKSRRGYFTQHGIQPDEVAREIEATDAVLGDPQAVRRFLADALQRFGGSLDPARGKDSVFMLSAGTLKPKLQDFANGGEFPIAITFDRRKDEEAFYLGRTQPLVARVCDAVLGEHDLFGKFFGGLDQAIAESQQHQSCPFGDRVREHRARPGEALVALKRKRLPLRVASLVNWHACDPAKPNLIRPIIAAQ
jgi:Helicase conserved C-terminal domain